MRKREVVNPPKFQEKVFVPCGAPSVFPGYVNTALPRCTDCGRPMREVRHDNGRCADCY